MNYKMKVVIYDPQTKEGFTSGIYMKLNCSFIQDDEGYGKKTYLAIYTDDYRFDNYYDLRYDENYHRGQEKDFLEYWAKNYWSGRNGAYAIKSIEIERVE